MHHHQSPDMKTCIENCLACYQEFGTQELGMSAISNIGLVTVWQFARPKG